MKRTTGIIATTHVDLHGDQLMLSALEGIVEQAAARYIPVGIEHDPRIPPIGRVTSVSIHALPDGEFVAVADLEIFEDGDPIAVDALDRATVVDFPEDDQLIVADDRSFRDARDQELILRIREDLGAKKRTDSKKSVDPVAVLEIIIGLSAGNAPAGFLQKAGADAWDAIKPSLKKLFARKRPVAEQLLCLSVVSSIGGERRLIRIVVSNPTSGDVESMSSETVAEAIRLVTAEVARVPSLVQFVLAYAQNSGLQIEYAVSATGVPFLYAAARPLETEKTGISFDGRTE